MECPNPSNRTLADSPGAKDGSKTSKLGPDLPLGVYDQPRCAEIGANPFTLLLGPNPRKPGMAVPRGIFPHIMGGKGFSVIISPPLCGTLGGKTAVIFPPFSRPWGENREFFPPLWGEKSPPQAENFEDLEIQNAKFP